MRSAPYGRRISAKLPPVSTGHSRAVLNDLAVPARLLVERGVFVVERPRSPRGRRATGARPVDNPRAHGARLPL